MSLDTARAGVLAVELIERLAEQYENDPDMEGVEVGTMALVVELSGKYKGEEATWVEYRCSDARRWVQIGFFQAALRVADRLRGR